MQTQNIKYKGDERRFEPRRLINGLKKEDQVCAFHAGHDQSIDTICKKVDTLKWFVILSIAVTAPNSLLSLIGRFF